MSDWLTEAVTTDTNVPSDVTMAVRMVMAVLGGVIVAALYRLTRRPGPEGIPMIGTLVLLSVLIALVTVAIGGSAARAFGLVGVLSIVRFRTVVDDTRDTAFVIFAVATGMAIGAGYLVQAAIGVPIVGMAAALLACWERLTASDVDHEGMLQLRLAPGLTPDTERSMPGKSRVACKPIPGLGLRFGLVSSRSGQK